MLQQPSAARTPIDTVDERRTALHFVSDVSILALFDNQSGQQLPESNLV
jgi:hypothetical protein